MVGAVVNSLHPLDTHAQGGIIRHCRPQELDGRSLLFVGMHLDAVRPRVVIDGDVGNLSTDAIDQVVPVAGHAVTGSHDASELLGVQVKHSPWTDRS